MLSFASKLVRSIEHSAETIIGGDDQSLAALASDSYFTHAQGSSHGFRVLSVDNGSPTHAQGLLTSWFDYIVGINGHEIPTNYSAHHTLVPNYHHFITMIAASTNNTVEFQVWSAKGGTLRTVRLPITAVSDGPGDDNNEDDEDGSVLQQRAFEQLWISLQWTPLYTATFVYHVLQIHPNSPAQRAGLVEHSDYIIGAQDGLLATGGEDLLGRVTASKKNHPLELYVYNHDYDVVRPVTITPTDNWGGVGFLGAGVGYGFLHRIPVASFHEPGAVLFDDDDDVVDKEKDEEQEQDHFSPVNTIQSSTTTHHTFQTPSAPPIHGRKKKQTHAANPDLLDYLQQEGEKSRELDSKGRSHLHDSSELPPPPRK
jgi:hypothetical protein